MDTEQSGRGIGGMLDSLIECYIPKSTHSTEVLKCKSFVSRVLSSRYGGGATELEENIIARMQEQALEIASENLRNDNWGQKRVSRLQECIQRLNKTKILKHRSSILKVLSTLSNQKREQYVKAPLFYQSLPKTVSTADTYNTANRFESKNSREITKPSENLDGVRRGVIRELLFIFNAIDTDTLKFNRVKDSIDLDGRVDLEKNEREIVMRLCELGIMYQKVKDFLEMQSGQISGLVSQSLCGGIKEELIEYYRFLAVLENMRDGEGLTFMSMYINTLEPLECMKWLLILCDACKPLRGGQILSAMCAYSTHGCPEIQHLVTRLLTKSLGPFLNFLHHWVYAGELVDPMAEFFVEMNKRPMPPEKLWADKYRLNAEMVPSFLSRTIAEQILIAGKTKTFLRKFCPGNQWSLKVDFIKAENLVSFRFMEGLRFRALENWVHAVYRESNDKLKDVIIKDFDFFEHCKLIKNFLLLGKGDFINALIEAMQESLEAPASKIFRHNLVSVLEATKASSSLTGYKPEYIDRVGIFLFEQSITYKGWDIFALHYEIDPPLATIFEPESMLSYHTFFNFVFKIRNLIYGLNLSSKTHRSHTLRHQLPDDVSSKFELCNFIRHQMLHFLNTFLSYLMLEVVETEWSTFLEAINSSDSVDSIIDRHREFVQRLMTKSLLHDRSSPLYKELVKLLECVGNYNKAQAVIFMNLESQISHARGKMDEESHMEDYSDEGMQILAESREKNKNTIRKPYQLISELWRSFRDGLQTFLEHLERDATLKSLGFRLDFNEYYKMRRQLQLEKVRPATRMDTERISPNPGAGDI